MHAPTLRRCITTPVLPLLMILITRTLLVDSRIMRWNKNTNFASPTNWDSGHAPCANEKIVFPAASPIVYVQNSVIATEIILPNDGQLIFSDGASLSISGPTTEQSTCPQRDVHYVGGNERDSSWFDSENWCEVGHAGGKCLDPQPSRLDLEGVPCSSDAVVFPDDTSFLVQLEHSIEIHVGGLSIAHQDYTTQTFRQYLKTQTGRQLFLRTNSSSSVTTPTTITIAGSTCQDEKVGCPCANSFDPALKEKVCGIELGRCKSVTCSDAITPSSHCCPICGAILLLEYGSLTRLKPLENLANRILLQQAPGSGVRMIVSKLPDGEHYQIVVVDDGSDKGMDVAQEIKKQIEADRKETKKYDVLGVTMQMSGYSNPSAHAQTGDKGEGSIGTTNIAFICVGLIVLLVILALAIYCTSNNRRPLTDLVPKVPGFIQRTWEARSKRTDELELARTVTFNNNVIFEAGFDNPNYGQGAVSPEVLDPSALQHQHRYIPASSEGVEEMQPDFNFNGSFANPLYGVKSSEAHMHAAVMHKSPLNDDVVMDKPAAEFPQKRPASSKEEGKSGPKDLIGRFRKPKHQRMQEDEDEDEEIQEKISSDGKKKKEKQKGDSEKSTSEDDLTESPKVDLGKHKETQEKKEKGSKSAKRNDSVNVEKEKDGSTPEVKKASRKEKKPKPPVVEKSGMHTKLVESSESEEDMVKDKDLGDPVEDVSKEKSEKKKEKRHKKKKKSESEIEESRGGFGNPLYALEEEARRQREAEDARKRAETSATEGQVSDERLIRLDDDIGESNA